MRRRIAEHALFFREFLQAFHTTGAILPSGRYLAAALTHFVEKGKTEGPRRILEVGPGTGAVTRRIIDCMGPADSVDLVELNAAFVERLRACFQCEPAFRAVADRARVLHCPVEELPHGASYDLIVSGLPLNNFAVADVQRILASLTGLLMPGGTLSFFEYIGVRSARAVFSGPSERARLRGIGEAMQVVLDGRQIRRDAVWLNVPPAWVHHLHK
jgi:phosphatidylethanolamine/phosphatidyl-N-methylethanolamine N-methyltransferase